jgi:type II secretory pathway pseudopilin PulG
MPRPRLCRPFRLPAAFTLVEALVAISITAIAASVLVLGIHSSLQTTDEALQQTIALGMAEQLLDEVLGARYHAVGVDGYQIIFGPSWYEEHGSGRERYDDIDDYDDLRCQPPEDLWGVELGTDDGEGDQRHPNFRAPAGLLDPWRQEVDVYYVNPSDLASPLPLGQVSDYRAVEVRILLADPDRGTRPLASLRRVVAYVPPLE